MRKTALLELARRQLRPLLIPLDARWRVVGPVVGQPRHYGYKTPRSGQDCRSEFPFLYGLDHRAVQLGPVGTPHGGAVEMRLGALKRGRRSLVLLDASEYRRQLQLRQQLGNDARLRLRQLEKEVAARDLRRVLEEKSRGLTPQELKVSLLLVEGKLNKQIASELNLTVPTVKGYVSAVLEKLGIARRTQIVSLALERQQTRQN